MYIERHRNLLSFGATMLLIACITPAEPRAPSPSGGTPAAATGSVLYRWRSVAIGGGGFVTGSTFSPRVKGLMYARTDVGGAWRLDPGGREWVSITDWLGRDEASFLGIESLALDPTDPDRVYMATGMYTQSWAGTGAMLRSRDRGKTWEIKRVPFKMGGNENGRHCGERLAVDPNLPTRILFGSRQVGLVVSEDGGDSWTEKPGLPKGAPKDSIGITAILLDAKSGEKGKPTPVIYAAVEQNPAGSVMQSRDGGKTWEALAGQPAKMLACHFDLDAKGMLYVSYGDQPGPNGVSDGAVYAFDPKAGTAKDVTPIRPSDKERHFGYAGLAVDPQSPGTVVVTTIDRWTMDDILRTTDGGQTWKSIGRTATFSITGFEWVSLHKPKVDVPGWMGDIDIDPFDPDHAVMSATWSTFELRKADAGKPIEFRYTMRGLEETCTNVAMSPPSGAPLLSGVADICGLRHEDLDRSPPYGAYDPPCSSLSGLDFAERDPSLIVRTNEVWGFSGKPEPHGALSTDGGKTWQAFATEPPFAKTGGMVAIAADGSSIVWTMKHAPAAVSRDRGRTWKDALGLRPSGDVPGWAAVDLKPASDRVDPMRFVIYDAGKGALYVSKDGGTSFAPGAQGLPAMPDYELQNADVEPVPGFTGHLWISTGKKLYRSTDFGMSVEPLAAIDESYGVGIGKAAPGAKYPTIFVAARIDGKKALYRSTDEGKHWLRINDDAHQYGAPTVIEGDPRVFGRVYVGASGRGIVVGEPIGR